LGSSITPSCANWFIDVKIQSNQRGHVHECGSVNLHIGPAEPCSLTETDTQCCAEKETHASDEGLVILLLSGKVCLPSTQDPTTAEMML
jgi:hypothetical protein